MRSNSIAVLGLCALLSSAASCHSSSTSDAAHRPITSLGKLVWQHSLSFDFDDANLGEAPNGWLEAQTGGSGAPVRWRAMNFAGARVVGIQGDPASQSTFNLLVSHRDFPSDVELHVKLRAVEGRADRGGGLIWRAIDANNYYVARWNPLERNLRAFKVEKGVRTVLRTFDLDVDADRWHELAIRSRGAQHEIDFDGSALFVVEDPTFSGGGWVGLWTKSDAHTVFDDLRVEWND